MKNFANSRIEGFNNAKIIGMIEHALRIVKSRNQRNTNTNYVYFIDEDNNEQMLNVVYLTNKEQKALTKEELESYKQDRKLLLNYYNSLKSKYNEDREEHNNLHKKRRKGEKISDSTGSWAEGVLTFSEQIENDYKEGKIDIFKFLECGIKTAKENCEYLGAELINVTLHLDEKCPHFHYTFKNFDDEGRSLTHAANIKKRGKTLNFLQDIMTKHFENDFGIKRGIPKLINSFSNHNDTLNFYANEINSKNETINIKNEVILEQVNFLNENNLKIQDQEEILKNLDKDIEDKKLIQKELESYLKDTKELRNSITNRENLTKEAKFNFQKKVSSIQDNIRNQIKDLKEDQKIRKDFSNKITSILKEKIEPIEKVEKLSLLGFEFFDEKFNNFTLDELRNAFNKSIDEIESLKMVITGMQFDLNKKDKIIGNMDYKINNVNSLIEIAKSEALESKSIEINELKNELESKSNELKAFKLSNNDLKEKVEVLNYKRSKTISKLEDKALLNKKSSKEFFEFIKSKNLIEEFKDFKDKKFYELLDLDNTNSSNTISNEAKKKVKVKTKRLANGKTKRVEITDGDIDSSIGEIK